LIQATNLLNAGFKLIPEGEEKHVVRLDAKSIEKVNAKEHERVSAAANVALHADRFEEYDRRKQWNTWALETYRQVTKGRKQRNTKRETDGALSMRCSRDADQMHDFYLCWNTRHP
jgi:hypothetical protein